MMCRDKTLPFRAERISAATFDDPHPNPEHMIGAEYDPVEREVRIRTCVGVQVGHIGDWLIESPHGGKPFLVQDSSFDELFEEMPA